MSRHVVVRAVETGLARGHVRGSRFTVVTLLTDASIEGRGDGVIVGVPVVHDTIRTGAGRNGNEGSRKVVTVVSNGLSEGRLGSAVGTGSADI